jgi:colanic acid biosynthesis glycosyl transferase WcaI
MRALRVVFVCQWYRPEPVSQPGWIVDALRRAGARVEVLTGIPNYPSGRVMPGYRAWRAGSTVLNGVAVHRTPLIPSHDSKASGRMLNYLSWAFTSSIWGQRHLKSADVALVYSSPATAALPAMFAQGFLTGFAGRLARWLVGAFANAAYRSAAHIVVISPGMIDLLESRGVPRAKMSLIYNWVEEQDAGAGAGAGAPDVREMFGIGTDDFVLMYAGNHGAAQALDSIVRAFGAIPESEHCHLVLVGDGVQKDGLRTLASRICPDRVHFVAAQPQELMGKITGQADVQLVSLSDRPLFAVTTPSKLQSILAAGHPVLVSAPGDTAEIVTEAGAGVSVPAESPGAVAAAVRRLRREPLTDRRAMGANGAAHYRLHMSEAVGARKLIVVLERAAQGNASDPNLESENSEGKLQR